MRWNLNGSWKRRMKGHLFQMHSNLKWQFLKVVSTKVVLEEGRIEGRPGLELRRKKYDGHHTFDAFFAEGQNFHKDIENT